MSYRCRVCHFEGCEPWMDFGAQPNSVRLLPFPEDPVKTHPLILAHCPACGFIFIPDAILPEEFYEELQRATSLFPARHLGNLVGEVFARLAGRAAPSIYEIGCNDGHFLGLLRKAGISGVRGIEPSEGCASSARAMGLQVETGFFGSVVAEGLSRKGVRPDMVVCRHVLEHILDLEDFVRGISRLLAPGGQLLLEIPDLGAIGERGDFSAIWEQHVNYFDLPVLRTLMARFGLRIESAQQVPHGGGTLVAFLEYSREPGMESAPPPRDGLRSAIFRNIAVLQNAMTQFQEQGKRVVGFGAGMRGTMLINLAGIGSALECILDDNPEKVGWFLPGSRLPIRSTQILRKNPPDYCLVLPLNSKETEHAAMARFPEFLAAGGCFIETLPDEGGILMVRP